MLNMVNLEGVLEADPEVVEHKNFKSTRIFLANQKRNGSDQIFFCQTKSEFLMDKMSMMRKGDLVVLRGELSSYVRKDGVKSTVILIKEITLKEESNGY